MTGSRDLETRHGSLFQLIREPGVVTRRSHAPSMVNAEGPPFILRVDADFALAGAWAGVERLAELAYLGLSDAGHSSVIEAHLFELYMVLPKYRDRIRPQNLCLTDTADTAEKTRYHQLDRAYRIINGMVGFILHWKLVSHEHENWIVLVDNFDGAQHLAKRFFAELVRRGATKSGITVIVACGSGIAPSLAGTEAVPAASWLTDLPSVQAPFGGQTQNTSETSDIRAASEHRYVSTLARHQASGNRQDAARTAFDLFAIYCTHGYYHEARALMDVFVPFFEILMAADEARRVYYVGRMNICLSMIGDSEGALRMISGAGAAQLDQPHLVAAIDYSLGMHYLRYAENRDLQRAEKHLLHAAALLRAAADDPLAQHDPFQKVFIDNGLAFLRARQGRPQEALDLCRSGYAFLTGEVGDDVHCLHRSVLLYNIAQVSVILGRIDDGIMYYQKSIEMDPHYSEYHNEIGNLLQDQERHQEAVDHYAKAIGCSAPYAEVYFNKAICHLHLAELPEALRCFETTLELNPAQPQAYALQADVLRELDEVDEALASYDAAITLGFDSPAVRVNRAVLNYGSGLYDRALADMNHVIAHEPRDPDHYENRAAIHRAMNEEALCQRDLAQAEICKELV